MLQWSTKPPLQTTPKLSRPDPRTRSTTWLTGGGLSLRIKPNGSKLWVFNYSRPHTKKRANLGFGIFPDTTLAVARRKAEAARALLAQNIDPKEHRVQEIREQQATHANTLEHIADRWLEVKNSSITTDHASQIWRSLELHVFADLGKRPCTNCHRDATPSRQP